MVFSNVNSYLAIKSEISDDRIKLKGEFMKDFELHKNKSNRIIPIALEKWYVDGVPIEQTIKNHKNIYDFCIRQKSSRDFHYIGVSEKGITTYKKLIRYYASLEGEKLWKIKNESCLTAAPEKSIVEKGDDSIGYSCKVCNFLPKTTKVEECQIDYSYYIRKCQKIIDKISLQGKKSAKKIDKNQLSLF